MSKKNPDKIVKAVVGRIIGNLDMEQLLTGLAPGILANIPQVQAMGFDAAKIKGLLAAPTESKQNYSEEEEEIPTGGNFRIVRDWNALTADDVREGVQWIINHERLGDRQTETLDLIYYAIACAAEQKRVVQHKP